MNTRYIVRSKIRYLAIPCVIFLLAAAGSIPGCSEDSESVDPPALAMIVECVDGAPQVSITNNGGAMTTQTFCTAAYEDGEADSITVLLGAGENLMCQFSNLHGRATVRIDGTALADSTEDCVPSGIQNVVQTTVNAYHPQAVVPSFTIVCTYDVTVSNFQYNPPAVIVTPENEGYALKIVYTNVTGDLSGLSRSVVCPHFSGDMSIDSLVFRTHAEFTTDTNGVVTLALSGSNTTVAGLDIQLGGVTGVLLNWLLNFFQDNFAESVEQQFNDVFGGPLQTLILNVIVKDPACD